MLTLGTLFNNVVRPSLVEYTAYSVVGTVTSIIGATAFLYLFPRLPFTLRQWAIACYALVAFIALWCLLGINKHSPIGFKHRAEFYVFQVLQNIAGSILAPLFRVLFPELFPKGSEIQYFGFQLVLSCSTVWIPQIVDGPIVQATNNQRLPASVYRRLFHSPRVFRLTPSHRVHLLPHVNLSGVLDERCLRGGYDPTRGGKRGRSGAHPRSGPPGPLSQSSKTAFSQTGHVLSFSYSISRTT